MLSAEASTALQRLGLSDRQIEALGEGESVAFILSDAAEGTIGVARYLSTKRFQAGIYTLKNIGGGLHDLATFEARARAAAKALGASELELMGIEITHDRLRTILERAGFAHTVMPVPEELGGGIQCPLSC